MESANGSRVDRVTAVTCHFRPVCRGFHHFSCHSGRGSVTTALARPGFSGRHRGWCTASPASHHLSILLFLTPSSLPFFDSSIASPGGEDTTCRSSSQRGALLSLSPWTRQAMPVILPARRRSSLCGEAMPGLSSSREIEE